MQLDPDDPKVRWATFGRQVEYFLQSDIGSYLVKRAKQESDEAVEELKKVDSFDGAKVAACQLKARVADAVIVWLGDAIAAGESATEQLKQENFDG